MRKLTSLCIVALAAWLLAACSDNKGTGADVDGSGARGSLMFSPPLRIASLTAPDFAAQLGATAAGQQLLLVTGVPVCGVDFHYIQYGTVDGGQTPAPTTASGALMVPTGPSPTCSGPRPIVLYAHGTSTDRNMNIADITNPNNTEGALVAAMFAAQGFIVVAPNYAGYDSSPLPYHPFLNADQQSKEMIDALTAARKALGHIFASGTTDAGILFVTGYSQGGHVAMATHKAMQALQAQNPSLTVTASAPMSGPYALEAFGDAVFFGDVNLGSTVFSPMLTTSYQREFGNIFGATTDVFEAAYATGIDGLLPSTTSINQLFAQGKLPQTFLFNGTAPSGTGDANLDNFFANNTPPTTPAAQAPLFALGFSPPGRNPPINLITNNYRVSYVADALTNADGAVPSPNSPNNGLPAANPQNTLRQAFKANDMRNWVPTAPVLLCGGHQDPTVFYSVNTQVMQAFWTNQSAAPTVIDVDPSPNAPVGPIQTGFEAAVVATAAAAVQAGATDGGAAAVTQAYHGALVPPFCSAAVRGFFETVLDAIPFPHP